MKKIAYLLIFVLLCIELGDARDVPSRPQIKKIHMFEEPSEQVHEEEYTIAHKLTERIAICIYILVSLCLVTTQTEKKRIFPENLRIEKYRKLCHKRLPRCSIDSRTYVRYNVRIAT